MTRFLVIVLLIVLVAAASIGINKGILPSFGVPLAKIPFSITPAPLPVPLKATNLKPLSPFKTIENDYHVFQTFNNCGPASLSMALSYYGIKEGQSKLGLDLRPYQNSQGDNDDKSVTLEEMANKALEYNLIPYHRPNGSIELIKRFISYDIPIITRTLSKEDDDIGHYRVVKGYDDTTKEFTQDDSLQGHNLKYSYTRFMGLWKTFDYEYLVLIPADKDQIARDILGDDVDEITAWKKAVKNSRKELTSNPDDFYARFNLSVALYHAGDYKTAVEEFEKVEDKLSFRTLWYQTEPIQAYYELGNYEKVLTITDQILNNHNRAFSELYILRGKVYVKQGNTEAAKKEFEKAVFYNINLKVAQELLRSVQ